MNLDYGGVTRGENKKDNLKGHESSWRALPTCCPARPPREEGGGGCVEMEGGIGEAGVTTEAGVLFECGVWGQRGVALLGAKAFAQQGVRKTQGRDSHLMEDQESKKAKRRGETELLQGCCRANGGRDKSSHRVASLRDSHLSSHFRVPVVRSKKLKEP